MERADKLMAEVFQYIPFALDFLFLAACQTQQQILV